jgi:hypothetical protein
VTDVDAPGGGRLSGMLRRAVKHRLIASVLALLLVVAGAACGSDHNDPKGAGDTTTTGATNTAATTPGQSGAVGPDTIVIFASSDVSQALEELTSTYKTAHPEISFQVTTGSTDQLVDQVNKGARPNVYIDEEHALGRISSSLVKGTPALLGTDIPVVIVKSGNPKNISGQELALAPGTTSGMCDASISCGVYGRLYLAASNISPAPDVVETNQAALVDDVAVGNMDIALVMRSASRNRFFKLSFVINWYVPNLNINYKIATLAETPQATEFIKYLTTFEAARKILVQRGLLGFYDLAAPASTPTTVAAAAGATAKKP